LEKARSYYEHAVKYGSLVAMQRLLMLDSRSPGANPTHNQEEVDLVLPLRPSYVALGHIFPTQTKEMPSAPQGVANLAAQVKNLGKMPTVAIGGISASHFPDILATGVGSIAVISAVTKAQDWQSAVKNLLQYFAE